jgi:NDP-sugar pyrophosphorylase family protein
MILSAGYGTRLWPLTEDRTKPAIPILGKPLVGYVAEYLARYGWRDILVNLHHRPDSVRKALGDGSQFGVKLQYIDEPVILGTSGALDNARSYFDSETFLVINGKLICDLDLDAALARHRESQAIATLVLLPNTKYERFTVVESANGFLKGFAGMPGPPSASLEPPLMFTGIQILEPRIFEYIPRGVFSHTTTDVYPRAILQGERVAVHVASGTWYELSTLQRYLDISLALLAARNEKVTVGARCAVDAAAEVSDAVLWDDVVVEAGAQVRRAVLADGVCIRSGEVIENAIVVRSSLIAGKQAPAKALPGAVRGDNFVVPLSQ